MYTYIHIPFCKSKCYYCDFFSIGLDDSIKAHSANNSNHSSRMEKGTIDVYIESLINEAKYRVELHVIQSWKSMYIGGGTPGILTSRQVEYLFSNLKILCPFDDEAEVTFEVNPADLAHEGALEYLQLLSMSGVNRISCGIQSLDDKVLSSVNRRSSKDECLGALKTLMAWKDWCNQKKIPCQISIDIIAGLPFLSNESFIRGLETILQFDIDHISLYSLTIEERTPLCEKINNGTLPYNEDFSDTQWLLGRDILKKHDFSQYEVSNFSKNTSCESKHNSAYWRMDDYIGIGCSACGTVGKNRYTGVQDIDAYCNFWIKNKLAAITTIPNEISLLEKLTQEEQSFEYLMMGFRTLRGVDAREYYNRFGSSLEDRIGSVFNVWKEKNLACVKNNFYSLTENGLLYLNSFLTEIV